MADKSTQLILAALGRAVASPDGAPLFAAKSGPGLFPSSAAGKQAAQRCKDEGWLRSLSAEADAPPSPPRRPATRPYSSPGRPKPPRKRAY